MSRLTPKSFTETDLQTDAWGERGLPMVWATSDNAWVKSPWAHASLFSTFDSRFFGTAWKEEGCIFNTRGGEHYPMIGREANYYYQGLIFAAFDQPATTLVDFIFTWKSSYAIQGPIKGEASAFHIPSQNDVFMGILGHGDYNWYDAHRRASDNVKLGPISRHGSIAQIWRDARRYRAGPLYRYTGDDSELRQYQ